MDDRKLRNPSSRLANPAAKLTTAQAAQIRHRLSRGETCAQLAVEYAVSDATIYRVRGGVTYVHLSERLGERALRCGCFSGETAHPRRLGVGRPLRRRDVFPGLSCDLSSGAGL